MVSALKFFCKALSLSLNGPTKEAVGVSVLDLHVILKVGDVVEVEGGLTPGGGPARASVLWKPDASTL